MNQARCTEVSHAASQLRDVDAELLDETAGFPHSDDTVFQGRRGVGSQQVQQVSRLSQSFPGSGGSTVVTAGDHVGSGGFGAQGDVVVGKPDSTHKRANGGGQANGALVDAFEQAGVDERWDRQRRVGIRMSVLCDAEPSGVGEGIQETLLPVCDLGECRA